MSIESILLLISLSLVLGLLTIKWERTNLLMVVSIVLMYWLQPETNLRYLGYWLPGFSLFLILATWELTAAPDLHQKSQTWRTALIILASVISVSIISHVDRQHLLGFNNAPSLFRSIPLLIVLISSPILLGFLKGETRIKLWAAFSLLIMLFIFLKTPWLTEKVSSVWRSSVGQNPDLASASEIQWLGFSYIAFRLLHIVRDKQAGRLPEIELNEFMAYAVFFPSLAAGPIARIDQVLESIRQAKANFSDNFWLGSQRILSGLFKKFVLADSLAIFALSPQNALQPTNGFGAWILLYAYSLQIYLDFSGYTDIAIGLGIYLGLKLPENFNHPYLKPSLTQFWNNWHMSLTNWFRSYFFNPLSRSLRKKKMPALSILLITQISTMVLVGLWHGITVNFALWGFWHGIGLLIQNRWSTWSKQHLPVPDRNTLSHKLSQGFGVFLTFNYVTLGWIWFVLPTPILAGDFLLQLLGIR